MWLNNPQCGHKEGGKFPFFGEITIKASPPIYYFNCNIVKSAIGASDNRGMGDFT